MSQKSKDIILQVLFVVALYLLFRVSVILLFIFILANFFTWGWKAIIIIITVYYICIWAINRVYKNE